jgi:hypothetical protein
LSGFKTLRSVFEDVCLVLLESIASAEKFDTHNKVNVKEPRTQWDNEKSRSASKHEAERNSEDEKIEAGTDDVLSEGLHRGRRACSRGLRHNLDLT